MRDLDDGPDEVGKVAPPRPPFLSLVSGRGVKTKDMTRLLSEQKQPYLSFCGCLTVTVPSTVVDTVGCYSRQITPIVPGIRYNGLVEGIRYSGGLAESLRQPL